MTTRPPVAAPTPARTTDAAARPPQAKAQAKAQTPAPAKVTKTPKRGMEQFVAAVQRQLPAFAMDRRDEELTELGEQTCHALAAGRKATAVADQIEEFGVTAPEARKIVGLARGTACRS